jgi:acetolactate synthase-1/2/3 large subunit
VRPEERVVCLTDRAGLLAAGDAVDTAARLGLPIVVIALDDGAPGPDLAGLAEPFGVASATAATDTALERAFVSALVRSAPTVIVARVGAAVAK